MNEQNGRWITTKSGNRVFIKNKDINNYMNDKIRNKRKYTKEDIKKIYEDGDVIEGTGVRLKRLKSYELNGMYLMNDPYGGWVINKAKNRLPMPLSMRLTGFKTDEKPENIVWVQSYKDGIEKLVEFANNKAKK